MMETKWEPYRLFDLPKYAWNQLMLHSWNHLVCWAKSLNKNELLELHDRCLTEEQPDKTTQEYSRWPKQKLYEYFLQNSLDTIKNFLLPLQLDPIVEKYQDTRNNLESKAFSLYKIYHSKYSTPDNKWRSHISAFRVSSSFLTKSVHQLEQKMQQEESQTASILFFIAMMVTLTIDVIEDMILLHPDCVTDDYTIGLRNDFKQLIETVHQHLKEQQESGVASSQYYDLLRSKAKDMVTTHPYSKLNNYLNDDDKELRIKLHTIRWLALLTTELVNKRILME